MNAGDNVGVTAYTITTGNSMAAFAINATNGMLTTANAIDYETNSNYSLTVQVADAAGNTVNASITINVINVDEPPSITNQVFSVIENVPTNTTVGTVIASDDIGITAYTITTSNSMAFATNGMLTTANAIDYETNSNYSLTVLVADAAGNTANATITVNVTDVDEIAPTITNHTLSLTENVPTNTTVGKVNAGDNVGVTAYTITRGNSIAFAINATNGACSPQQMPLIMRRPQTIT